MALSLRPKRRTPKKPLAQHPRQITTGTTYAAKGYDNLQPPDMGGEQGSSQPVVIQEIVPALSSGFVRLQTYTHMMNDAGVDVSIRVTKAPILGSDFYVDPASGSDLDTEIAQFIEDNLFGGLSEPFLSNLEDIVHFFEDGFSVMEKVFETREWTPPGTNRNTKNYTMLAKLGTRPASTLTVDRDSYDNNGNFVQVMQTAIQQGGTTAQVPLKANKLLVFTFNRKGGDITGKSLLRTAYPHWYYKTHLYKIDAIQKERNSLGVPRGKLLAGYNQSDRNILRTLLANLRSNEEAFIIQTPNVDIDFVEVKSNNVNVLESANHHNNMLLMNVLAQFLALGLDSGGGRATAASQTDIMMKALRYIANYICEVINTQLIPELVVYNYPTRAFPKLKVRNIGETRDLQAFASALGNLFAQEVVTGDLETEQWVRFMFDMPQKLDKNPREPRAQEMVQIRDTTTSTVPPGTAVGGLAQQPATSATTSQKGDVVTGDPSNAGNTPAGNSPT